MFGRVMLHKQEFDHAKKMSPILSEDVALDCFLSSSFTLTGTVLHTYHLTKKEVNGNSFLFYVS